MAIEGDKTEPIHFDRHAPGYIHEFEDTTRELHAKCPIAWSDTYGGHWVTSGYKEVFEIARMPTLLSNHHDIDDNTSPFQGITIPGQNRAHKSRGGFLEMDPPEQQDYRRILDPYLSPAAIARWKPMTEDVTRAAIDAKIESGSIDFVDDVANIVPAVMTLALMGLPLTDWEIYCEPAHAGVYTRPDSPDMLRVAQLGMAMGMRMTESIVEVRNQPRPGMVDALVTGMVCEEPLSDPDIRDTLMLLIGGGFDTTTALTAHSLEWLSENPNERDRLRLNLSDLLDSATEEFLRFYTPAPGDGRTVASGYDLSGHNLEFGDRLWLSWAMANRDPSIFPDPDQLQLDRPGNRHTSFGLGLHRCIGSNQARVTFKTMLTAVLQRMPDYVCDPSGAVHYDTIGVINGMKHLPATFTPGKRLGPDLEETMAKWQTIIDEQQLAAPVTRASAKPTAS